ncbi:MAG: MerC domain-containing protein [Planctomycetaceae bacterium]|nr:MerC domain-containing protein [Planctomycetaceae bacterium]
MSVSEPQITSEFSGALPLLTSEESATRSPSAASGWGDMLGVTASVACAIHCAAMPFVIGFLPAMGLSFLADEAFHKWMAGACFLIGLAAFVPGWKRHGRLLPAGIAASGLTIITFAAFGLSGECCPTCEAAAGSRAVAAADGEACCDENCTHCATESQTAAAATDGPACCEEKCEYCEEETVTAATKEDGMPAGCEKGCDHGASEAAASLNATDKSPVCTDEECAHCAAAAGSDSATPTSEVPVAQAGFFATYAAWWTPLGGLLMVIGHLLNRNMVSGCSCCGTDDSCLNDSASLAANRICQLTQP